MSEYVLYRHFLDLFRKKVAAEDASFPEEVRVFKLMRNSVESFCSNLTADLSKNKVLRVKDTRFSERFSVTFEDCQLLMKESSSVKDTWFEEEMIKRIEEKRVHAQGQ